METELPKIKITLKPGEPMKVEAINFKGSSCIKATEALLNMGESRTELKTEFYEQEVDATHSVNIDL